MLMQNETRAFLGKYLNDLQFPLRHRNDGNSRDHSGTQMAKNQTAIRCRLQIMHKGARTSRCGH